MRASPAGAGRRRRFMRSIRRILVAVKDPEARSLPAVNKAAQIAHALGADMELFHGISTPLYVDAYPFQGTVPKIERAVRNALLSKLDAVADRLRAEGLRVSASVEWDYPAFEAVVRRANQFGADLIVAERHAGRHFFPSILRLTDWELLRTSPVPVLLVKSAAPYERPAVLAAVDPGHSNAKPANLDANILRAGSLFSRALRGELHAVHAYMPAQAVLPEDVLTEEAIAQFSVRRAAEAASGLDRVLKGMKVPKTQRHLVGLPPINAIEDTARRIRSPIVVMGAVSRSGLKRLFIGNTAEALLDRLSCDVLVIKPDRFAARVQRRRRGVRLAAFATPPGM